jgi:glutamate formiminotransferase
MLECVVNVSEGCDARRLADLDEVCGHDLLDRHSDCDHHRSVFTLAGEAAVRNLTRACVERLDIAEHQGAHPRLGVVDVAPFVPLAGSTMDDARRARDDFARWASSTFAIPVFVYGPVDSGERQLPDIRRSAFRDLAPDFGPSTPHPTAGAICAGVRDALVAYNVWLNDDVPFDVARAIARNVRGDGVRTLALRVGSRVQISTNLVEPRRVGPMEAFDRIRTAAESLGARVTHGELVGLLPSEVLERIPRSRWSELDVEESRTIESRLEGRRR